MGRGLETAGKRFWKRPGNTLGGGVGVGGMGIRVGVRVGVGIRVRVGVRVRVRVGLVSVSGVRVGFWVGWDGVWKRFGNGRPVGRSVGRSVAGPPSLLDRATIA